MTPKLILAIIGGLITVACFASDDDEKFLGDDVRLFRNTPVPVWEVAQAIQRDDTAEIRRLLERQPDSLLNYQEKRFRQSLLHWAVYTDHLPSVELLLKLGADPNVRSYDGTTAVIEAAGKYRTTEYLRLLLSHGGDVNVVADSNAPLGKTTPLIAAASVSLEHVKMLIEAGADPGLAAPDNRFGTPLNSASLMLRIDIVKYLLFDIGVDYRAPTGVTMDGDTLFITDGLRHMLFPLESEDYQTKMEVVRFLKERGMDYWNAPVPQHYYRNYDSTYLEKY